MNQPFCALRQRGFFTSACGRISYPVADRSSRFVQVNYSQSLSFPLFHSQTLSIPFLPFLHLSLSLSSSTSVLSLFLTPSLPFSLFLSLRSKSTLSLSTSLSLSSSLSRLSLCLSLPLSHSLSPPLSIRFNGWRSCPGTYSLSNTILSTPLSS